MPGRSLQARSVFLSRQSIGVFRYSASVSGANSSRTRLAVVRTEQTHQSSGSGVPAVEVKDDPIAEALGAFEGLLFHRDTFDVPAGGTLIAKTDEFNHAFRFGSAVGVQAHPEVTGETALGWIDSPNSRDIVENAGVDRAELRSQIEATEPQLSKLAEAFFSAWFAEAEAMLDSSVPT